MGKIQVGDKVYRRTISDHVLTEWKVIAKRGWFHREYYLVKDSPVKDTSFIIVESHRNLFKVVL